MIDEAQRPGGQIFRKPRPGLRLDIAALLGAEAENYRRTHAAFDALRDRIDYRPQTLAWAVDDRTLHTLRGNEADTIDFDALILATGATDRTLPVPGWTLPGVFTLGGAQVLLKEHGCLIGRRIVFCGVFAPALSRGEAVSRRWAPRSSRCSTRRRSPASSPPHPTCWRRPARSRAALDTWPRCAAPALSCTTA